MSARIQITLNSDTFHLEQRPVSYAEIVQLAHPGINPARVVAVTYKAPGMDGGLLLPGCSVPLFDGMVINAIDTSGA